MANVQRNNYIDRTDKNGLLLQQASLLSSNLEQNANRADKRKAAIAGVINAMANHSRQAGATGKSAHVDTYGSIQGDKDFDKYFAPKDDLSQEGYSKDSVQNFTEQNMKLQQEMEAQKRGELANITGAQDDLINTGKSVLPSEGAGQMQDLVDVPEIEDDEVLKLHKKHLDAANNWGDTSDEENLKKAFEDIKANGTDEEKQKIKELESIGGDPIIMMTQVVGDAKAKREADYGVEEASFNQRVEAAKQGVTTKTTEKQTAKTQKGGKNSLNEEVNLEKSVDSSEIDVVTAVTQNESQQRMKDEVKNNLSQLAFLEGMQGAQNVISGSQTNPFTALRQHRENFLKDWQTAGPKTTVDVKTGKLKAAGGSAKYNQRIGATTQNNIALTTGGMTSNVVAGNNDGGNNIQSTDMGLKSISGEALSNFVDAKTGKFIDDTQAVKVPNIGTGKDFESMAKSFYASRGGKVTYKKIDGKGVIDTPDGWIEWSDNQGGWVAYGKKGQSAQTFASMINQAGQYKGSKYTETKEK